MWNITKHKNLFSRIKNGERNRNMDIEIEKKNYHYICPILLKDTDIEKVLVSKKTYSGESNYKYFVGYLYNDHKVKLLHIMPLHIKQVMGKLNGCIF